ncbi:MAG: arsenate reductase ArsC [Planctomycetota bacterium]|nr:arsenate reductase ArsC [Planctomycetota bacterium]
MKNERPSVLFLCTGNSCRSQMAEGWAHQILGDRADVYSAGLETHGLNPNAVQVMLEAGVDIRQQQSQHIDAFARTALDVVISVCAHADENCPVFPAATKRVHHGFDDPPKLAKLESDPERALEHYRRVRDEIRAYVDQTVPGLLGLN